MKPVESSCNVDAEPVRQGGIDSTHEDSMQPATGGRNVPIVSAHYLRPCQLAKHLGLSEPTLWRRERGMTKYRLPPRDYYIDGQAVGWKRETVDRITRGEKPPEAA